MCRYPAFAMGDTVLTMQPHPEIKPSYMQGLIEVRGPGIVPQERLDAAGARLDTPLDARRVADHIAAFFKQSRGT